MRTATGGWERAGTALGLRDLAREPRVMGRPTNGAGSDGRPRCGRRRHRDPDGVPGSRSGGHDHERGGHGARLAQPPLQRTGPSGHAVTQGSRVRSPSRRSSRCVSGGRARGSATPSCPSAPGPLPDRPPGAVPMRQSPVVDDTTSTRKRVTSPGWVSIAAWGAATVSTRAPMRWASSACVAGSRARSSEAMR